MNYVFRVAAAALLIGLGVAAYPAHAEMKFPEVGATTTYECTGPYGKRRISKVVRVEDGVIRREGHVSGRGDTFTEETLLGIGTTLFKKRDRADRRGVHGQKYDEDDFKGYENLEPGSKFSGKVREWDNRGLWYWNYRIEIGQPKIINHKVFGEIQVVPVTEKRNLIGGGLYRSKMRTLVYPKLGLELTIIFQDGKRDYKCDVKAYE